MPLPINHWEEQNTNCLIHEESTYNPAVEAATALQRMGTFNVEQRAAYDSIIGSVMQHEGKLFFLHGPAGTGKTFVYNTICSHLHGEHKLVLCVASSGI